MPHFIRFETLKFDPRAEPRNPINPIGGHSVLSWLREALVSEVTLSEPETEDWGWYATTSFHGSNYLVGAVIFAVVGSAPELEKVQLSIDRSAPMDEPAG